MKDYTSIIREVLKEAGDLTDADMASMTNDKNISDFGIDSLSLVEAVIGLESEFGTDIDVSGARDTSGITVNDLNAIINEKLDG